MVKSDLYKREFEKLSKIFAQVEEDKRDLVQGLIEDAAFLYAENQELKKLMNDVGMLKVNPNNPSMQKQSEAGKQYLKNINSYSVVIKTLNSILDKNIIEEDDEDMSEFE